MFVQVRHGDDQVVVVNSDCATKIFLREIKDMAKMPKDAKIDLADETGLVKDLASADPFAEASNNLQARQIYVLLQVDRHNQDEMTPMLKDILEHYPRFSVRCKKRAGGAKQGAKDGEDDVRTRKQLSRQQTKKGRKGH